MEYEQTDLREWEPYPYHLQNPNGRLLATAGYLLKYHGYTYLSDELQKMSAELLKTPPSR